MLEKDIENKLRLAIRERGGIAYKWTSPGNAGVPDRIVMLPFGILYFVEIKRSPNLNLTSLQKLQREKINKLGHEVRVVKGLTQLKHFIEEVDREIQCRKLSNASN